MGAANVEKSSEKKTLNTLSAEYKGSNDDRHEAFEKAASYLGFLGFEILEKETYTAEEVFPNFGKHDPGKKLRGYRYREGLTQEELAIKADVKQSHISEMESNKRSIGKNIAKRFAEILNVDYRRFL